jgi:hypothetical protein
MDVVMKIRMGELATESRVFYETVSRPENQERYSREAAFLEGDVAPPSVEAVKKAARGGCITMFLYNRAAVSAWCGGDVLRYLIGAARSVDAPGVCIGLSFDCAEDIKDLIVQYQPNTVVLNLLGLQSGQPTDDTRQFPLVWRKKPDTVSGGAPRFKACITQFREVEAALTGHPCLQCVWLDFDGSRPYAENLVRNCVVPVALGWDPMLVVPTPGSPALPKEVLEILPTHVLRMHGVFSAVRAMGESGLSLQAALARTSKELLFTLFQTDEWKKQSVELGLYCDSSMQDKCSASGVGVFGWRGKLFRLAMVSPMLEPELEPEPGRKSPLISRVHGVASPATIEAAAELLSLRTAPSSYTEFRGGC